MAAGASSTQFAALLRRSKFASFDPTIGQVYASHGGHLHRGNWGLKRPLPIRRREAHIMVNAVDSREEQTEWKLADTEARFMKMWDEVGVRPNLVDSGPWATKLGSRAQTDWRMDTEFADASEADAENKAYSQSSVYGPGSSAIPNVYAMSDKQFKLYLEKLRKSRSDFAAYLKEVASRQAQEARESAQGQPSSTPEFTSFWESSSGNKYEHRKFLGSQAHAVYNSRDARIIEQQPQTFAGLSYSWHSLLQSHLLSKPQPGRVLPKDPVDAVASFAGMRTAVETRSANLKSNIDFIALARKGTRDPKDGVAMLRLRTVQFTNAPQTVSKEPQGLRGTRMEVRTIPEGASDMQRSNTHRPGSREYVAHDARKIKTDTILSPRPAIQIPTKPEFTGEPLDGAGVLTTLRNIVKKKAEQ